VSTYVLRFEEFAIKVPENKDFADWLRTAIFHSDFVAIDKKSIAILRK